MTDTPTHKRVAILATDGFEEAELFEPKQRLEEAGCEVQIVSDKADRIEANRHRERGEKIDVDVPLQEADADAFDALVIPGGLFSPDTLRVDKDAIRFTRAFFEAGKPVGSICHGPQILINACVLNSRHVTAVPPVWTDLKNAGANVTDEQVVVDNGLVTSRTPDDLNAFCHKLIEEVLEGSHTEQARSA